MILINVEEYKNRIGTISPRILLEQLNIPCGMWQTDDSIEECVIGFLNDSLKMSLVGAPNLDFLSNLDKLIVFYVTTGQIKSNGSESKICCIVLSLSCDKDQLLNQMKRISALKVFL